MHHQRPTDSKCIIVPVQFWGAFLHFLNRKKLTDLGAARALANTWRFSDLDHAHA